MTEQTAALRLLCWTDYLSPVVLKQFADEQGVTVELVEMASDDECPRRVMAGERFDVIMASDISAQILAREGLLQTLDLNLLPNLGLLEHTVFATPPYDPGGDGRRFTTVNFYGTEGFAVRLDRIPHPTSSWEMLFDPPAGCEVAFLDGSRETLEPALYLQGSDGNCTDPEVLEAATRRTIAAQAHMATIDSLRVGRTIAEGVPVVHCWDGDVGMAIREGVTQVRYVLPREGFSVWADAPCIPADAERPGEAHLFLDYLMRPDVSARNADFSGYHPAVPAAAPLVKSLVQQAMRPTVESMEQGVFLRDLGAFNDRYTECAQRVYATARG
jgi:spermidine/putrescine transport system substrate-binding protein